MKEDVPAWFPYAFPLFFIGLWLAATTMLGFMSGWFGLQQWYADERDEEPLLKLRGLSGTMGLGVSLGGILTLSARKSGLSMRIWKLFGPFQKPLLIPWKDIEATQKHNFFVQNTRLHFGKPPIGKLTISSRVWSKLVEAARPFADSKMPEAATVSRQSTVLRMVLEWAAITIIAASFFYFVSRSQGGEGVPIAACIALPAIVFGIGQLVRFAREG